MAEAQDPYGLMAALAPPQQQAVPLVAPYVAPMAATFGAGLSAIGAQQSALQKQLFEEEERRRKEREAEMQTRGKQIYDVGMATFQPEVAARGAAMQTGGLMPMGSGQFKSAVEMAQLAKGAESLTKAAEVGKVLTPESAKALLGRTASQIPTFQGLEFDFAQKAASRTAEGLQRLKALDDNLEARATGLQTSLAQPGVLTGEQRKDAQTQLDLINKSRAILYTLPDDEVNRLYQTTMEQTPPLEYGVRSRVTKQAGTYVKVQGDRKVTTQVDTNGNEIITKIENLDLTKNQAARNDLAREAGARAQQALDLNFARFDWAKAQDTLNQARKDRDEGRLNEMQKVRLRAAEQLFRLRDDAAARADQSLQLEVLKYLYPSIDPVTDMKNAYDSAREVLIAQTTPDGRSVRQLLGSRSSIDKEEAELFIAQNIDAQAAILFDKKLASLRGAVEGNPGLFDAMIRNLRAGRVAEPDLLSRGGLGGATGGTGRSPTGATGGLVPAPPAFPPARPATPVPGLSGTLPGGPIPGAPRLPALPPAIPAGAAKTSRRATPPTGPTTLKGAVATPETRRGGVRIRPVGP